MDYIRKRVIKMLVVGVFMVVCISGCGRKASHAGDTGQAEKWSAGEENTKQDKEQGIEGNVSQAGQKADNLENTKQEEGEEKKESGSGEIKAGQKEIPAYGVQEKEKVKAYLAELPDEFLSFQDMKRIGVIGGAHNRQMYRAKELQYFEKQWFDFYKKTQEHWCMQKAREKGEAVYDIGLETAMVLATYTTEGDLIYDYISYINGRYYLYTDSSRDKFGGGFFEAEYSELRSLWKAKGEYTEYYLLGDDEISDKTMKKLLKRKDGYNAKKLKYIYKVSQYKEAVQCR